MKYKYIRIDCDNVGDKIELCLYESDTQKAQDISDLIKQNIQDLAFIFRNKLHAEILLIGSDDILAKVSVEKFNLGVLLSLNEDFCDKTGITLSIGVGNDIIEAMRNLDIAKKSGKNRIYPTEGL